MLARIVFAAGCILLAFALWPLIALVNHAEPFVFGLPPFVFTMFLLNILVAALLAFAYWKAE